MKLVIIRSNLKDGLGIIDRASGENTNLPILKNFLIETEEGKVKLTTTNLEIGVSFFTTGKIIEDGRATIPLGMFSGLINNLQTERLNLEAKNNTLTIKTDNYSAVIQGLPPEDFPLIPKIKNNNEYISLKSDLLKESLRQVVIASQFSELRPELSAVLLDFAMDGIKLVATDSFRLSEKTIPKGKFTSSHQAPFKLLIPLKTSQEVLRILPDDGDVRIYHDDHQVLFKTDQWEFISRLTEGAFPDYTAIIPKSFHSEVVLDREEFIAALKLVGVFGSRISEAKIRPLQGGKAVELFSVDQGIGENNYILTAKVHGDIKEIGFNWHYLIDGLKALKTKEVYMGLNEDNKPAILKSPNEASYFYILMPILKT